MNRYGIWAAFLAGMMLLGSLTSVQADMADVETDERIKTQGSIAAGYRGTSVHGDPGRAREYDSLKSSPLFGARLFSDQERYHLDLEIDYLNDEDYSAEAHLDTKGLLRIDLRSERFFHNLDHIPYADRPSASLGAVPRVEFSDQNPEATYGLRLDFSEAKAKVKCPDYPAHFNISYWRFEKEGDRQQRFVDENCAGACHMQSKSREIDRVTEEVKASVDAHAGILDIVFETLFRTFRDHEPVPVDDFGSHSRGRTAGSYEHTEDPDSRLKEMTLRLNTAPSGGLVGSASFTLGERENRSDLTSVAPVDAETDYYKTAADITYTPSQNWTFNLRYRFLDLDSDNNSLIYDTVSGGDAFKSPLAVRESMDITRSWYEAIANYRPSNRLTFKGEFRREEIDRSNTGEPVTHSSSATPIKINPTWQLPDEEIVTRVKLGFSSRLLEKSALKLSGWVAVQQNDDPAYGTSYGDSQELFLGSSYAPSPYWGMQANVNLLKQENDDYEVDGENIDREKEQQTVTLGTWLTPRENLSFDLYYGYFRTAIDQNQFFGINPGFVIEDNGVDYKQTVQTVTAGMTWQAQDTLSCRLEGYHIRSKANYSPDFPTRNYPYTVGSTTYNYLSGATAIPGVASSSDLEDISKVDIVQNGLKGRVDWKVSENLTCGLEATFDDYDEKGNDVFDGSVQSYLASLTYTF